VTRVKVSIQKKKNVDPIKNARFFSRFLSVEDTYKLQLCDVATGRGQTSCSHLASKEQHNARGHENERAGE